MFVLFMAMLLVSFCNIHSDVKQLPYIYDFKSDYDSILFVFFFPLWFLLHFGFACRYHGCRVIREIGNLELLG